MGSKEEDAPNRLSNSIEEEMPRPSLKRSAKSLATLQLPKQRPVLRTAASSVSLYSHFAGERFESQETKLPSAASLGAQDMQDVSQRDTPTATVGKAMFVFLKAFIGSGVLFLPKAFDNGGLALSILLMIAVAAICIFAFLRLFRTQQILGGSYGDVGGKCYGSYVRYAVLFFIVMSQLGFACSYLAFISGNIGSVASVLSRCTVHIDQKYYIWIPLAIVIPLALIRHIARLSFTAVIADVFILFGLLSVVYFTSKQLHDHGIGPGIQAFNPFSFGMMIATFSFEGIGLVIPIAESMEKPGKFPMVVALGTTIVCIIYVLMGSVPYLAYGSKIQSAVVYNLPPQHGLTLAVQILYSVAILLSIPLQLFPALKILEAAIFPANKSGRDNIHVKWLKNIHRVLISCFCALVAFSIGANNLDKFVSLVGSVACGPLCYIFPGMFHFKVASSLKDKIFDVALTVFGVAVMIYTTYITIFSFTQPPSVDGQIQPLCP
ncbi:hypothetical protein VTP01DRAFT_5807 [Rhizomucor pusillus]|uniref:uncharacterized protein n=1 Tax=Rhizomucor pusillus TaxID=4840 RepID=UPI003742610E